MATSQISPIDAINKIVKEKVTINPNPVRNAVRGVTQEEWDKHKEDKVDRIKNEKKRFVNGNI